MLTPHIAYTIGYPGQSALKCVLPAVQKVVDQGFVNENAMGIQGHSWGGCQIAYDHPDQPLPRRCRRSPRCQHDERL